MTQAARVKQIDLGSTGLRVSEQGLGCMGMSHAYGPTRREDADEVLQRALSLGVNFWDTADFYGQGDNELLLAPWLARHRDEIVIASKFGMVAKRGDHTPRNVRGDAAYVKEACEASLKRLGVETIDLYYLHRIDLTVPIEETVGAMAELVREGKIRYLGLSEVTASELRRAQAVHPITAVQSEWSLWSRDVEESVVPTCRELGVGFVPYAPLGRGFLTGRLPELESLSETDFRRAQPRLQEDVIEQNRALVKEVEAVAGELGVTAAQVALAWVQARSVFWKLSVVPIPGTKQLRYLEENVGALRVELPHLHLARLEQLGEQALGVRHPQLELTSIGGRP